MMILEIVDLVTFPHSDPIVEDDARECGGCSLDKDEVVTKKRLGPDGVKSLASTQDGRLECVSDVGGPWRLPRTFHSICIEQVAQYLIKDGVIESS